MANFGPKPWKNINFSTFSTSTFYSLEKRFWVLEYRKTTFPGQDCLKKKHKKLGNFGPKPPTNPFGKISIFRLSPSCFYSLERRFFTLEYYKTRLPDPDC